MRILFAADDSSGAEHARTLVASLCIPKGSTIRVIRSAGPIPTGENLPDAMRNEFIATALRSAGEDIQNFAEPLRGAERTVEADALYGRPASAIIEEAERWRPDLIVVGAHGRGAVVSAVLGSVGAEVIDHAPCPVLVARTTAVSSVVVAYDGSSDADAACRLVATGIFNAPVRVVSVAHVVEPLSSGVSPTMRNEVMAARREELARVREEHESLAKKAADSLREAGLDVTSEVRVGSAGEEILAAATPALADLIAMGTRGRTGLKRLLLGSVARKVLYGATCSVLVARGTSGPR
ncbi:MAG: universal stress protein [Chloroflexota bacterium]